MNFSLSWSKVGTLNGMAISPQDGFVEMDFEDGAEGDSPAPAAAAAAAAAVSAALSPLLYGAVSIKLGLDI